MIEVSPQWRTTITHTIGIKENIYNFAVTVAKFRHDLICSHVEFANNIIASLKLASESRTASLKC